ncbi:MAG: MFS transporter [Pseudomonadales bacterium]|nr:MFS transporter [Pseudomonadales bacterium]
MSEITITNRERTYTLFLLVTVFTSSHVDRQIVAILQEPIKQAFAISDTQLGLLTGVMFAFFYATLGMPMAMWADRRNRRNLITFSITVWSAMTALCGAALQFWQLLIARIGVGVGEAGSNPPSHSIISDLYGPNERATAMAIFGLGVNFGVMLGYLIGGWVNEWLGWRWAFVVAGAPGLLIALLVRLTMVEPPRGYADGITDRPPPPPFWTVVATMWRNSTLRHLLSANILISFAGYAGIAWAPVYFQRVHEMSTGESGTWLAIMIGIGGGLGTFGAGYFADKLGKNNEGWRAWVVTAVTLIYIRMAILSFLAEDKFAALFWFAGPAFLGGAYIGTNFAILQSQLGVEMRSVGAAINLFLLNIVGLGLGPLTVGIISDWMTPTAGIDSVRYGLLFTVLIMAWGAIHQFRVGQLLRRAAGQS